jgi:mRNA interferase RelE/StbE
LPYSVAYAPAALRQLAKLDPSIRGRVYNDIEKLGENPRPHGVEKLRVYVGPGKAYRAIYQIQDRVLLVLVVKVGNRKEIYCRLK